MGMVLDGELGFIMHDTFGSGGEEHVGGLDFREDLVLDLVLLSSGIKFDGMLLVGFVGALDLHGLHLLGQAVDVAGHGGSLDLAHHPLHPDVGGAEAAQLCQSLRILLGEHEALTLLWIVIRREDLVLRVDGGDHQQHPGPIDLVVALDAAIEAQLVEVVLQDLPEDLLQRRGEAAPHLHLREFGAPVLARVHAQEVGDGDAGAIEGREAITFTIQHLVPLWLQNLYDSWCSWLMTLHDF